MSVSTFCFTCCIIASIIFLNYLPFAATYGFACIIMYFVVGLVFFLPVMVITTDLARQLPEGGIYMWVSEAFGRRFGLFAVYVQWLVSLTFQPAVLSYSATAVAYVLNPEIAQSGSYTAIVTVAGTWVLALLGCCGFRVQCYMITACVLVGTLLPLVTVTCIVAVRLVDSGGFMDALPTDIGSAPHLNDFKELKSLTGMLFQFGGVELFAVYISMLPNGIADYTFAVKMAALIVFILYLVGTLVITLSSSPSTLAAHATLLEVLPAMGLEEIAAPMALFVGIGGIGMAMAWVLPPAVGLVQCLRHTQILPFLHHVSSWGVPTTLIAIQTIFITFLCTLFMLEDVGSSFWVFTAVSAQLQLVMYITMFLAALRLQVRKSGCSLKYSCFHVYCAAGMGLVSSSSTLCFGFAQPKSVSLQVGWHATLMALAVIVVSAVPLALPERRRSASMLSIKTLQVPNYSSSMDVDRNHTTPVGQSTTPTGQATPTGPTDARVFPPLEMPPTTAPARSPRSKSSPVTRDKTSPRDRANANSPRDRAAPVATTHTTSPRNRVLSEF
jgi:amino acid transporter